MLHTNIEINWSSVALLLQSEHKIKCRTCWCPVCVFYKEARKHHFQNLFSHKSVHVYDFCFHFTLLSICFRATSRVSENGKGKGVHILVPGSLVHTQPWTLTTTVARPSLSPLGLYLILECDDTQLHTLTHSSHCLGAVPDLT